MTETPDFGPDHALFEEGRQRMAAGDLDGAVEAFAQSARHYPHFKTLELLGECLFRLGRYQEAVIPLAAASTLNMQVRAPSLLAQVFLKMDERLDARRAAQMALARDPKNRAARDVCDRTEDLAEDYDKPPSGG